MGSAAVVFLLLAAVWVSSTVAVAPCSDVIIAGLSQHAECYPNGQPPSQQAGGSAEATYIVYTPADVPCDVKCISGSQDEQQTHGTNHYLNGSQITNSWNADFYPTYIEESKDDGSDTNKYRMYVIRNEMGAYAFYRCISEGESNGTGTHAVHVAVGCKYTTTNVTLAVVESAKKCFNKLNINNYVNLEPCAC